MIEDAKASGIKEIKLNAQVSAAEFYRKLGFCEFGEQFTEAGILHVEKKLQLHQQHTTS